jgi:hypothetical protein
MDLHAWITAKVTETEDAARATLVGRHIVFKPNDHGRPTAGTITDASHGPDGLNLVIAQHGVQPVDAVPAHVPTAEAILRRCEADRRILARHKLDLSVSWEPSCEGCGTYGDMNMSRVDDLNECPELLDLAHAHGITKGDHDGLDQPELPQRKPVITNSHSLAHVLGLRDITPMSELPTVLRGPAWSGRHG